MLIRTNGRNVSANKNQVPYKHLPDPGDPGPSRNQGR